MNIEVKPADDRTWVLASEDDVSPEKTRAASRFTISNGFLGVNGGCSTVRGMRSGVSGRTYVAGLFDTPEADHAVPELVPAADWLRVRLLLSGQPMVCDLGDAASDRIRLDMKRGVLRSETRCSGAHGLSFRVNAECLVSMDDRTLGLQVVRFEIETGIAELTLEAWFDDPGLVCELTELAIGAWRTQRSGKRLAMATALSLQIDGLDRPPTTLGPLRSSWGWTGRPGQVVCFERMVTIVRSDIETVDPRIEARRNLDLARQVGCDGVVRAHEMAWASRWRGSDIVVDGDAAAQRALRFALYHLNSAANPADERVSIGARALTGDNYRGHVFWDTEIFLLPFYILTWPEAARTLLMYRFHTLAGARAKAARMGWRGALYAWESADTGDDTTPDHVVMPNLQIVEVLCGKQEQHISADVAYAVWQYWQATGDAAFLCDAGAEMILETGRFWASRAALEADGRYHIRGVIGPDEYHEHIDDNAYTNVMARWNIRRALDIAALLEAHWPAVWAGLSGRLGLDHAELAAWRSVIETMATGLDPKTGLFEQFSGYFELEDIDLSAFADQAASIDLVLGRERVQHSQLIKQADVVALLALLPETFAAGSHTTNFRYYEPRCCHASSLSPAMHGLAAARLGDTEMALRYFRQAAAIDLAATRAAPDGGVHIAALGGLWMLVVFGFAGLSLREDGLAIEPRLPAAWRGLAFEVQWRGRCLGIRIDREERLLEATLTSGEPMTLAVGGRAHALCRGPALRVLTA